MSVEKNINETIELNSANKFAESSSLQQTKEHGNRKFDAEKVARIKAQLVSGNYEINPASIVSKMVVHNS